MNRRIIFSLMLTSAVLFMACKKKSDDPAPSSSGNNGTTGLSAKTTLLTAHNWYLSAITADKSVDYDGDGTSSTDVYAQYSVCRQSTFLSFAASGTTRTGYLSADPAKCSGSTSKISYTWSFNASETTITYNVSGGGNTMTILQLDDNTLKVSYPNSDHNDLDYIQTETYIKK